MVDKLASLEITVLSAEGLSLSRRPIKKNAFVTVRADPDNQATTRLDTNGGSFPRWDERLCLALPRSAPSIAVEVRCMAGRHVRTLGRATIRVSDFYGGPLPADYLHFLSYRLRDHHGERNGIINLSIRSQPLVPTFSWLSARRADVGAGVAVGIPLPSRKNP